MNKKQVWKYQITPGRNEIELPKDAQILAVQTQYGNPCLWVLVNPKAAKETRYFDVFGTGHDIPYDMGTERHYIGTFQLENGHLIFHLFENTGI